MRDQSFRFILEEPNADGAKGPQRKRARLVTACDTCRAKKIKCVTSAEKGSADKCDACTQAATPCLFSDRDRYHAERGVSVSEQSQVAASSSSNPDSSALQDQNGNRRNKRRRSPSHRLVTPSRTSNSDVDDPVLPPEPRARLDLQADPSSPLVQAQATAPLKRLIVPFFRYFGPTANTPGYRRIRVRTLTLPDDAATDISPPTPVKPPSSPHSLPGELDSSSKSNTDDSATASFSRDSSMPNPYGVGNRSNIYQPYGAGFTDGVSSDDSKTVTNDTSHMFDSERPRYPSSRYLPHLATLFFDRLACHFPFLDREDVMRRVNEGTLPAILANCLAGLAVRYSDQEELLVGPRYSAGEPFCDMAKLLIVHMLSWPSLEVLQALILIAWSEFGSGRDSGLWMYSRMAVGMAMDLGLGFETTVQLAATEEEREKVRLTWWAVVLIDRINSWGTGRPIAIADNQFDTALPSYDVFVGEDLSRPPPPSFVYGHLCRLVQLRGKMGDVLNNLVKRKVSQYPVEMELSELQSQIASFYQSLPPSLIFTIQNFRRFSNHKQAATFLLLHVMFHSVITLLHRPSLLQNFTPDVAVPLASNIDLSRSSARSIIDMIGLANEVDEESLLTNPFLDLPILTAGRAFLAERELMAKPPSHVSSIMVMLQLQWGESSLERCKEVLEKMSLYWGGVGSVKIILDQQSSGRLDFDIGEGATPDSRIASLRDVELMKQWATSAWRRQRPHGAADRSRASSPRATTSTVPLLPLDHNSGQYGTTGGSHHEPVYTESPEEAAIGITGFLDAPPVSDFPPNDPRLMGGVLSGQDALRISFNAAEADLSFGNYSNELFSIPEGFEEFLASHVALGINGPTFFNEHTGGPESSHARDLRTPSSAGAVVDVNSRSVNELHEQLENGSGGGNSFGGGIPGGMGADQFFPAFSSLGLPMQQFSRAPSPTQR